MRPLLRSLRISQASSAYSCLRAAEIDLAIAAQDAPLGIDIAGSIVQLGSLY